MPHRTNTWRKRRQWRKIARTSYIPDPPRVPVESVNARMIRLARERPCG